MILLLASALLWNSNTPVTAQACLSEFRAPLLSLQEQSETLDKLHNYFLDFNQVEKLARDSRVNFEIELRPGKDATMRMLGHARALTEATGAVNTILARLRRLKLGPSEDHLKLFDKNFQLFFIDFLNYVRDFVLKQKDLKIPVEQAMEFFFNQERLLKKLESRTEYICGSKRLFAMFTEKYNQYIRQWDDLYAKLLITNCGELGRKQYINEITRNGDLVEGYRKTVLGNNPYLSEYHRCEFDLDKFAKRERPAKSKKLFARGPITNSCRGDADSLIQNMRNADIANLSSHKGQPPAWYREGKLYIQFRVIEDPEQKRIFRLSETQNVHGGLTFCDVIYNFKGTMDAEGNIRAAGKSGLNIYKGGQVTLRGRRVQTPGSPLQTFTGTGIFTNSTSYCTSHDAFIAPKNHRKDTQPCSFDWSADTDCTKLPTNFDVRKRCQKINQTP